MLRPDLTVLRRAPIIFVSHHMSWLEQKIRRYEHARWTTDDNRRVFPFEWGLEHIGGRADEPDPRGFLAPLGGGNDRAQRRVVRHHTCRRLSPAATGNRGRWAAAGLLTFTSQIESPWAENNLVPRAIVSARGNSGPAVVVMPNWNAKWHGQVNLCRWLNRCRHHRAAPFAAVSRPREKSRARARRSSWSVRISG